MQRMKKINKIKIISIKNLNKKGEILRAWEEEYYLNY